MIAEKASPDFRSTASQIEFAAGTGGGKQIENGNVRGFVRNVSATLPRNSLKESLGRQNSSDSPNCNCWNFSLTAHNNSDYVPTKIGLHAEKGQIRLDSPSSS